MAQAYEVHTDNGQESTAPIEEVTAIEEVPSTPEAPVEETTAPEALVEETASPVEEDAFAYARDLASKNAAADDATRSIGE